MSGVGLRQWRRLRSVGRGGRGVRRKGRWRDWQGAQIEGVDGFREMTRVGLEVGEGRAAGAVDGVGRWLVLREICVYCAKETLEREPFAAAVLVDIGKGECRIDVVDFDYFHAVGWAILVFDEIGGSMGTDSG